MTTTVDVSTTPPLTHDEAMDLQRNELDATLALLRSLDPHDWERQTECPAWDVRQMYLHVLGACEGSAMRELAHQMRAAMRDRKRDGGPLEAHLSAVQVADRAHLGPAEVITRLTDVAPKTVARRRRLPGMMRNHAKMKVDGPVVETWRLGYLIDTIYLRDVWMHRIDACRSTDRQPELTADHDGRIVADVVAEWARRHGRPFRLVLTGPAGGTFTVGDHGDEITMDAVDFCRTLAGREPAQGLLATVVPF